MAMPAGTEVYNIDTPPVLARGTAMSANELEAALSGTVADMLLDTVGQEMLGQLLSGLATTSFSSESVERILSIRSDPENWRVGEAVAEAYLKEHRNCDFPWPSGRDLKNPNSSPAGTDLVGFQGDLDDLSQFRFAFGEVKTSEQDQWPPSVVFGRHGLTKQIENLRDQQEVKDNLVKYLGHHSYNAVWQPVYKVATQRYLNDPTDISLFGFLIRDVEPRSDDLSGRAAELAQGCSPAMSIELRAIYLPKESIQTLAALAKQAREKSNGS